MAFWFGKKQRRNADGAAAAPVRGKVGLCLSGGGSKGFAHVGALRAFEELGIDFDLVAGTSAGSLVGALYAFGLSADKMTEIGGALKLTDIRDHSFLFSPSNAANIEALMRDIIGDALFSDLKKPFAAVTVDLRSGTEVILSMGSVARAVSASCCVPGIFKPVIWDEFHLVDGGLKNVIPADVVRAMGADKVVSIDINSSRGEGTDSLRMLDIIKATLRIAVGANAKTGLQCSDIVISPDTRKYRATSKDGFEEMIEAGYNAAAEAAPRIMELFRAECPLSK
jgi:NTE family protein